MENKPLNTIEMIRKIRAKHARHLSGKTHAERIAYYREQAAEMSKRIPSLLHDLNTGKLEDSDTKKVSYLDRPGVPVSARIGEKGSSYK